MSSKLSADQIIRAVYDANTNALNISQLLDVVVTDPIGITDGVDDLAINTDGSLNTMPVVVDVTTAMAALAASSNQSASITVLNYKIAGVMVSWAGVDAADGVIKLQASLDGVLFDDIASMTVTMATATSQKFFNVVDTGAKTIKIVYTKGTNAAGTVTAKYCLKA